MEEERRPQVLLLLASLVSAVTLYTILRSVGALLRQVQQSGSDLFGGMESLGSGLLPGPAIARTQSLLLVWHDSEVASPGVKHTILYTSYLYTFVDALFILSYTVLLVGLGLRLKPATAPERAGSQERWALFQQIAGSKGAILLPVWAAAFDIAEDVIRLLLINHAFARGKGDSPTWAVALSWGATTGKFVLIGLSVITVLLLIRQNGAVRRHGRTVGWALWRMRVPVGGTLLFVALVLADPTGQAADLIRRWIDGWDNALIGLAAAVGSLILGFTVWLITRRLVLADQTATGTDRRRRELTMTAIWAGVLLVTAIVAIKVLGWPVSRNSLIILIVAAVILLAAVLLPGSRPASGPAARWYTDWRTILVVAVAAGWTVSFLAGWRELRAIAIVGTLILVLELLALIGRRMARRRWEKAHPGLESADIAFGADRIRESAAGSRERDLKQPDDETAIDVVRRTARGVAVAAPVALLIAAAGAFAPVPLVLILSDTDPQGRFWYATLIAILSLVAAPAVAVGGIALLRRWDEGPRQAGKGTEVGSLEWRYAIAVPVIILGAAFGLIGGAAHWRAIGPLSIIAAFLATAIIVLGEAQLRSETHDAPPSFLLAGFSRVPPVTLLVLTALIAGFTFSDGSGHEVFKSGRLPDGLTSGVGRGGVDLATAFQNWAARNCANVQDPAASVPLILVSAPGGGLRAAYWTASTLTGVFGATAAPSGSCAAAAPSERVFAVGGASGGSLGELSWIGGLDAMTRSATWYDDELAHPDFLTDPLSWLLTVDLSRGFIGFKGQDRARRLENRWTDYMTGLKGDFFAGSWGLGGGTNPIPLLTSTQVETGCRLNVSGLRVTDATVHQQESSCTTVHDGDGQADAPAVSDLLDYVCGPKRGSRTASLSRATAALMSARFPWVSPSGQLDRCAAPVEGQSANATRVSVVDGGYADNTGMGLLLDMWPSLEPLIAQHNSTPGIARIVPVFLEVDNHYAEVAAPATPPRTAETLVPPLTKNRPDELDDLTMRARVEALFAGPVPGTAAGSTCKVDPQAGRYLRISPKISPGLPAPLAWTLSDVATEDLRSQRTKALKEDGPRTLIDWVDGRIPAGC